MTTALNKTSTSLPFAMTIEAKVVHSVVAKTAAIALPLINVRQVSCARQVWNVVTLPIRYFAGLFYLIPGFTTVVYPFEAICAYIADLFYAAYYQIVNHFTKPQLEFTKEQISERQKNYWGLGNGKIREGIEKKYYDSFGPHVFDRGLHDGAVEPGFKRSWERAVHFLSYQFNRKMDADLYLDTHSIACSHFLGSLNGTLMGQDRVGVFRDSTDSIMWENAKAPDYELPLTAEGEEELEEHNQDILEKFGTELGHFCINKDGTQALKYANISREQATAIFDYFAETMHREIESSGTSEETLRAICAFTQKCEWLHPVRDGCGRTDFLILNFLLTQYGFHPALLAQPYICNVVTLDAWVEYVLQGMLDWELATAP